jgi:hypothetical protein
MRKLRMIITSVIVIAIIGSAFAFNAKKIWRYCTSGGTSTSCNTVSGANQKRITGTPTVYYVPCWEGTPACTGITCTVSALFAGD